MAYRAPRRDGHLRSARQRAQAAARSVVLSRRPLLVLGGVSVLWACDRALSGSPGPHPAAARATGAAMDTTAPASRGDAADRSDPLALAAPSTPACTPPATSPPSPQYYVHGGPKAIALTIDDGPDPRYTGSVLALLAAHGIRATFCMVGKNVDAHPALVREVIQGGHLLANHTWSHPEDLGKLSLDQVRKEIQYGSWAIEDAGGASPAFFRAPGGYFTADSLAVCARLGLTPLSWSVDSEDWTRPGANKIATSVLQATRTGSIILNHDGGGDRSQTVAALRVIIPSLLEAGYRFTVPAAPPAACPS